MCQFQELDATPPPVVPTTAVARRTTTTARGAPVVAAAAVEDHEANGDDAGGNPLILSPSVQALLDELSPKELEWAARSSYRYFVCYGGGGGGGGKNKNDNDQQRMTTTMTTTTTTTTGGDEQPAPSPEQEQRDRMEAAAAMAHRYLTSKSSPERAVRGMRATLLFRAERDLDATRIKLSTSLFQYLQTGNSYVTGRDLCGRATLVFIPRLVTDHAMSVEGLLWTLERAIACSQYRDGEINAIVDFSGFELWRHSPPMAVGKAILSLLRNYYVGHVHRIFFLNATTAVNQLWNIFHHLAGQATKEKIVFVHTHKKKNNNNKTHDDLEQLYNPDQLPPSILATGSFPEFQPENYFAARYDALQCE